MALLNKLKSILGIGGSRDGDDRTDTSITVERESTSRTEADSDEGERNTSEIDNEPDQAVAAGTDASASTGSMTDADEPKTDTAAEASEAAGPPTESVDDEPVDRDVDDVIDEAEDAESDDAAEATDTVEQESDSETTEDAKSDDPEPSTAGGTLTAIKGIGPAYSERLEAAGIGSVDELAAADAETLASKIDVSSKIVSDWIDRAADQ